VSLPKQESDGPVSAPSVHRFDAGRAGRLEGVIFFAFFLIIELAPLGLKGAYAGFPFVELVGEACVMLLEPIQHDEDMLGCRAELNGQ